MKTQTLAVSLSLLAKSAALGAVSFYVSPTGNDANPGSQAKPFATLERARDELRKLKTAGPLSQPVKIHLRQGVYRLAKPFELRPEDSGTAQAPITYSSYQGERPVLSGGRAITGWRKGAGPLWTTTVPGVKESAWYPHQLFVNGERCTRARTPNEGYLRSTGPLKPYPRDRAKAGPESRIGFRFTPGDLKRWGNLQDTDLVLYHSWTASWHGVANLDEQEHTVQFTNPSGWPVSYWEKEQRYHVENFAEALDAPGEWYLNRQTGELSYWPKPGEDMRRAEVTTSMLRTLLQFAGDPDHGKFVDHVRFVGLSFMHTDWDFDRTKVADGQAAVFLGATITANGARHCVLEGCEIAHLGEYAVNFARGCHSNRIELCHIHDLGAGGVRLGEPMRTGKDMPQSDAVRTGGNVVHNNFIHDGGHVFPAGIGVWVGQSANNTISHNEVCDFYYSGISLGWTWGYGPHEARGNDVEFNHIHHLGKGMLSDMGGIYTLGNQPGTVLRNNVIHDVLSYSYGGWGLYTDEGSTDIVLENNIVYLTKTGGFHQHYGKNNLVRNNIFALAAEGQIIRSRQEEHTSFTFERNIVYQDKGPLLGGNWGNKNYRLDSNVYWRSGNEPTFAGLPFEEWQEEMRQDAHSIVANPKFVSVETRDFRLQPDSPALKLGFKPIDTSTVGLVGTKPWIDLPKNIQRPPTIFAEWKELKGVEDSFEDTPIGQKPANATVSGAEGTAMLAVTEETAASGRRSLKVADAAGLPQSYQPHFYYKPAFLHGTICVSFDLRVDQGALPWFECRDANQPYRVGPSLRVDAQGQLQAARKSLMSVPLGQWFHLEATFKLGKTATGTYDLLVKLPNGESKQFGALPFGHQEFKRFQWFGFMSMATKPATYYVDNLKLESVPK